MARAASTDFLQSFRFHVALIEAAGEYNPLQPSGIIDDLYVGGEAGFQSVTLPELSAEPVEYREGTWKYTKKFVGPPTVSDSTLIRGVTSKDTAFFQWAIAAISGGEYRVDLDIQQFARTDLAGGGDPSEMSELPSQVSRSYICHECEPTRCKPGADMDATSGEVSMQEVDFALEWFEVKSNTPLDGSNILPQAYATEATE